MTATPEPALRPCAHCGDTNLEQDMFPTLVSRYFTVCCSDCQVIGPEASSSDLAIAAWNRRIQTPEVVALARYFASFVKSEGFSPVYNAAKAGLLKDENGTLLKSRLTDLGRAALALIERFGLLFRKKTKYIPTFSERHGRGAWGRDIGSWRLTVRWP